MTVTPNAYPRLTASEMASRMAQIINEEFPLKTAIAKGSNVHVQNRPVIVKGLKR